MSPDCTSSQGDQGLQVFVAAVAGLCEAGPEAGLCEAGPEAGLCEAGSEAGLCEAGSEADLTEAGYSFRAGYSRYACFKSALSGARSHA